ncbi:uncharacterized protein LOC131950343 [Physella acuta]|uniref:uncharacterized protein LOC131950343 n=1 Tax=Physella acuta TaxID=109671 RepID=UPI0027DCE0B2|nr:uncharacterized protein LOC131950343 [Physella acuta]
MTSYIVFLSPVMIFDSSGFNKYITPFIFPHINLQTSYTLVLEPDTEIKLAARHSSETVTLRSNNKRLLEIHRHCARPCVIQSVKDFQVVMILGVVTSKSDPDSILMSPSLLQLVPTAMFCSEYMYTTPGSPNDPFIHYMSIIVRSPVLNLVTLDSRPLESINWHYAECTDLWMSGALRILEGRHQLEGPIDFDLGCYVYGVTNGLVYSTHLDIKTNPRHDNGDAYMSFSSGTIEYYRKICKNETANENALIPSSLGVVDGVNVTFLVNTLRRDDCTLDYFGKNCMHECKCKSRACNNKESCFEHGCDDGYFGYHCLFRDVATKASNVSGINLNSTACSRTNLIELVFKEIITFNFLFIKTDRNGRNIAGQGSLTVLTNDKINQILTQIAYIPVMELGHCLPFPVDSLSIEWVMSFQSSKDVYSISVHLKGKMKFNEGFTVLLYNTSDTQAFVYGSDEDFTAIHHIQVRNGRRIKMIKFIPFGNLKLCKFQVYGDCGKPYNGLDCDETCSLTCLLDRCNFDMTCIRCNIYRYGPHCLESTFIWEFNSTKYNDSIFASRMDPNISYEEKNFWRILPILIIAAVIVIFAVGKCFSKRNPSLHTSQSQAKVKPQKNDKYYMYQYL